MGKQMGKKEHGRQMKEVITMLACFQYSERMQACCPEQPGCQQLLGLLLTV